MEYILRKNEALSPTVFRLVYEGPHGPLHSGQFAQVSVPSLYLRRPISLCDWDDDTFSLVIREVGEGTRILRSLPVGSRTDILLPLGSGFDLSACGARPLLVGGGVGLPPLLALAKALKAQGKKATVLCGFSSASDAILTEELLSLGCDVRIATLDGSLGQRGLVTDLMAGCVFDSVCACGPRAMMKAVFEGTSCPGQYSFEERMACGYGACMGCSVPTRGGMKRVCAEGPVFDGREVIW